MFKELARKANEMGICAPGMRRILGSMDTAALLEYYVEGLDFCLNENFPSAEYLKLHGGDTLASYGIHVDEKYKSINQGMNILLGECDAAIEADGYHAGEVYIKHNSKVMVEAKDSSILRIDCFDDSEVSITASGNSKVTVNVYASAKFRVNSYDYATVNVIRKLRDRY